MKSPRFYASRQTDVAPTVAHFVWFPAPQGGRALGQGSQSLRDTLGAARRAAFVKSVL